MQDAHFKILACQFISVLAFVFWNFSFSAFQLLSFGISACQRVSFCLSKFQHVSFSAFQLFRSPLPFSILACQLFSFSAF